MEITDEQLLILNEANEEMAETLLEVGDKKTYRRMIETFRHILQTHPKIKLSLDNLRFIYYGNQLQHSLTHKVYNG